MPSSSLTQPRDQARTLSSSQSYSQLQTRNAGPSSYTTSGQKITSSGSRRGYPQHTLTPSASHPHLNGFGTHSGGSSPSSSLDSTSGPSSTQRPFPSSQSPQSKASSSSRSAQQQAQRSAPAPSPAPAPSYPPSTGTGSGRGGLAAAGAAAIDEAQGAEEKEMDSWRIAMLGDGGVGKTALAVQVRASFPLSESLPGD